MQDLYIECVSLQFSFCSFFIVSLLADFPGRAQDCPYGMRINKKTMTTRPNPNWMAMRYWNAMWANTVKRPFQWQEWNLWIRLWSWQNIIHFSKWVSRFVMRNCLNNNYRRPRLIPRVKNLDGKTRAEALQYIRSNGVDHWWRSLKIGWPQNHR